MSRLIRTAPLVIAFLAALFGAGCGPEIRTFELGDTTLHVIKAGIANVSVLEGPRGTVLIDAGDRTLLDHLDPALSVLGLSYGDFSRAVITHAHNDHAGGGAALREKGVKVWLHAADVEAARAGVDTPAEVIGVEGHLIDLVLDHSFPPVEPDNVFDQGFALDEADAVVEYVGGHTAGSVVVVVDEQVALLGDLARGGILTKIFPDSPMVHYFHEDRATAHRALADMLVRHPSVQTFVPAHGGVFTREALQAFVDDQRGR